MKETKARIIMILSMTAFGTIGIFVRQIDLPPQEIVLFRVLFGLSSIILFYILSHRKFDYSFLTVNVSEGASADEIIHARGERKRNIIFILLSGIGLAGGWLFFFTSYNYTTVAIATLCNYFEPCIVMVASIFLFKEKVTTTRIVCFLFSTAGLVLVVLGGGTGGGSPNITLGVVFGLLSAAFYSMTVICTKQVRGVDGLEMTVCQLIVALCIISVYTLSSCGIDITGLPPKSIICLVAIGVIHTGIVYSAYIVSMVYLKTQEVAVLAYLDPSVSVLSSVFVLKEPINFLASIGAVMVIGFMVLNELKSGPPKSE
jgi:Predicted permeases